jgi:hypothetical protein
VWFIVIASLIICIYYFRRDVRQSQNENYLPRYTGYWFNKGSEYNEDWEWKEPIFRKRYVNLLQHSENYKAHLSWMRDPDALDCEECEDQIHAQLIMEAYELGDMDKIITLSYEELPCWIQVFEEKDILIIKISETKKELAMETIPCFGQSEAKDLIQKMNTHYSCYRRVCLVV